MGKYDLNISVSDYEKAAKKKKTVDDLYKELDDITEEYEKKGQAGTLPDFELPDKLELDRVEYEKKDKEELKRQAETENSGKYADKIDAAEKSAAEKTDAYRKKTEDAEREKTERQQAVDALYDERKKSAESQALQRGLARSSVIMSQIGAFDRGRIDDKLAIDEDAKREITELQNGIDRLQDELEAAKQSYDSQKQTDIEKRLFQLLDEQEEKYLEALKFNNDVSKKETDYLRQRESAVLARAKAAADLDKNRAEYGSELGQSAFLQKKFDAVKGYLDALPKEEALSVINGDKTVKAALGSYYRLMRKYIEDK